MKDLRAFPVMGESLFPSFRDFYRDHNPQFFGPFPCPLGTPLDQVHIAMADTVADYMDLIASVMSAQALGVQSQKPSPGNQC